LDNEVERDQVSNFILLADREILDHYNVMLLDDQIQSFTIDQWMGLYHKTPIKK
jgi:hypothetical protein